jgi:hypothetical protein
MELEQLTANRQHDYRIVGIDPARQIRRKGRAIAGQTIADPHGSSSQVVQAMM